MVTALTTSACSGETGGGTGGGGTTGAGGGGTGGGSPCGDGVKSGDESDVDCGGSCGPCDNGKACGSAADCQIASCVANRCVLPGCDNGVVDGNETDVDCGGKCDDTRPVCAECDRCAEGRACVVGPDCASQVCVGGACVAASCTDNVQNGGETDVDCGGSCPACADSK